MTGKEGGDRLYSVIFPSLDNLCEVLMKPHNQRLRNCD